MFKSIKYNKRNDRKYIWKKEGNKKTKISLDNFHVIPRKAGCLLNHISHKDKLYSSVPHMAQSRSNWKVYDFFSVRKVFGSWEILWISLML